MTPLLGVKEESALLNNEISKTSRISPSRRNPAAGLLALACLLVLFALSGCGEKASEAKAKPTPVEVGVIVMHPQSVPLTTELPGRTTSATVAVVRPQVDGIVLERLFREGSEVNAGDVLYRIDPAPYRAAYNSALAALKKAEASLPSSASKAKRYSELIQHKAISNQDYEDAKSVYESDLAAVASARAEVQTAKINLDYTDIKAPISGRIEKSELTPGALVTANQSSALTTIRQMDPINVDLTQSSSSYLTVRQAIAAGRITVGPTMTVQLKLENGTIYPYPGKLEFSEAKVDEGTGTYTLRAEFPNPDRLLLPGMYVRAIVSDGLVNNCYLVPQRAVSRNTKGEPIALTVEKDGKVAQRVLSVRKSIGNSWLVDGGLSDGDKIIVDGSQFVRPGQPVNTKEMTVDDATGEVHPIQAEGNAPEAGKGKEG
ncbi:efflux RND transporter periplasmic adaptor subunit [Pseudodesulfovibrio sp.]|uniref:efflux RND transporter periplasmic adaptor subunit n=1 Tax=unclassified Pseudodesulfovibrio TaxID=2661612 RepID=UPI003B001710